MFLTLEFSSVDVLRMEYRSKFLNPKWTAAMLEQGSGGAYEVSQRMTAMVGWVSSIVYFVAFYESVFFSFDCVHCFKLVDNFVFEQAAERYALDEEVAKRLQKNNPEAFKNVVRWVIPLYYGTNDRNLDLRMPFNFILSRFSHSGGYLRRMVEVCGAQMMRQSKSCDNCTVMRMT